MGPIPVGVSVISILTFPSSKGYVQYRLTTIGMAHVPFRPLHNPKGACSR